MPVLDDLGRPDGHATFDRFRSRMKDGDDEGALEDGAWCWAHVTTYASGMSGVRRSYLLSEIFELGERYPPALAFLEERRDQLRERLEAGYIDTGSFSDYQSLNRALGDEQSTVSTFEIMEQHGHEELGFIGAQNWETWSEQGAWDILERHPPNFAFEFSMTIRTLIEHEFSDEEERKDGMLDYAQYRARALLTALDGMGRVDLARTVRSRLPRYVWDAESSDDLATRLDEDAHDPLKLLCDPATLSEIVTELLPGIPQEGNVLVGVDHHSALLATALSMASGVPMALLQDGEVRGALVHGETVCLVVDVIREGDDRVASSVAALSAAGATCAALLCITAPDGAEDARVSGLTLYTASHRGSDEEE